MIYPEIKLISFDAAGTLIELAQNIGTQYASVALRHGVVADAHTLEYCFQQVFAQTPALNQNKEKGLSWWSDVIENTFASAGINKAAFPNFAVFCQELYDSLSEDNTWRLYPEVVETLEALTQRGWPLIVFSNFDERLFGVLQNLKINHYFRNIYCSTQLGLAKPNPQAYAYVAQKEKLFPEEILHVGDSWSNDYQAAKQAGMSAIFLERSKPKQATSGSLEMIGDLKELLL